MIEDGRIFEAVVGAFVVAGLQIELADPDVFGGALGVVDLGGAVRGFELELLPVRVVEAELVGISGPIAALVVLAHRLGNLGPGKLDAADNLMAHHRMIRHFLELFGIQRTRLAE